MRAKSILALLLAMLLAFSVCALAEEADAAAEDATLAEGYTEEGDGWRSEVRWCKNGELNIYGEFYYPADFDASRKYPVVIMSHGGSVTHEFFEKADWPSAVTELDCVTYAFDFCGGSERGHSDLTLLDMTVETEIADLCAVMDFVQSQSFCDPNQLYLMGQSFGGLVTSLAAGRRGGEVAGMILLYPALSVVDVMHETYPARSDLPTEPTEYFGNVVSPAYFDAMYDIDVHETQRGYVGDALLIHGMNDPTIPYTYSVAAFESVYGAANSELLLIGGKKSGHAFELIYPEGKQLARGRVQDFLKAHIAANAAENEEEE